MKLFCPDCGGPIPAADVNLDRMAAKCGRCDAVFGFADVVSAESRRPAGSVAGPAAAPNAVAPTASAAALLPRPRRFAVEEFAGTWRVRYRWFTPAVIFLAFFCVAWDGFLVFWYTTALTQRDTPWLMIVFPVCHLAVGVGLTYTTLAGFVNRTTVEVAGGLLTIRHAPLPWAGNRTLRGADLTALYVEPGRGGATPRNEGQPAWQLSATLRDGSKLKLLTGFTDPADAKYLEQQIETRLRLPPRPVVGEVA